MLNFLRQGNVSLRLIAEDTGAEGWNWGQREVTFASDAEHLLQLLRRDAWRAALMSASFTFRKRSAHLRQRVVRHDANRTQRMRGTKLSRLHKENKPSVNVSMQRMVFGRGQDACINVFHVRCDDFGARHLSCRLALILVGSGLPLYRPVRGNWATATNRLTMPHYVIMAFSPPMFEVRQ